MVGGIEYFKIFFPPDPCNLPVITA